MAIPGGGGGGGGDAFTGNPWEFQNFVCKSPPQRPVECKMILKRVNWFSFVSQCLINVRGFLFDRKFFLSIFSDKIDIQ